MSGIRRGNELDQIHDESGSEESDDDTSDVESYSEEDQDEHCGMMMKPVFIPKQNRLTIHEAERKVAEQEELAKKKLAVGEARKAQTRIMVAESVRRMEELQESNADDADSDTGLPDDTDRADDEVEVSY